MGGRVCLSYARFDLHASAFRQQFISACGGGVSRGETLISTITLLTPVAHFQLTCHPERAFFASEGPMHFQVDSGASGTIRRTSPAT